MSETQNLVDEQNTAWAEWLWRRGEQPGVVRLARAHDTAVRLTHLNTPPLSDEVARRYAAVIALQAQLSPIVYAEPLPAAPESATAVPAPAPKRPLPIVTAQPTAVPASPPPTILAETPAPIPVRQASTAVPAATPSSPATPTSRQTAVSAQPTPNTLPPAPEPLPVVRPAGQPKRQAQASRPSVSSAQPATIERDTAVPIPQRRISMPEQETRARPSASPIAPVLPVVRAAATPPAVLVRDVPQPITSAPPVVTPVRVLPSEVNGTSNGRAATPLPLVQAQATAVNPPPSTPLPSPLPLAQPMGGAVGGQRAAMDTAVPPVTAKPQPTPTPNRVVQTNSVIQRVKGEGETAHTQADDGGETTNTQIDMDELVEKVHRRFLRKLAVEGERRGKTLWP